VCVGWDSGKSNDKIVFSAVPMNAKHIASSSNGIPKVLDSLTDGTKNYYLLDVGIISDMYISTLAQVDYTGVPVTFSKEISTSETYTNSLTRAVSESITTSRTDSTKIGVGAEFIVKGEFSWTWTGTKSNTTTKSTSTTETTAKQYAEKQTVSYQFGSNSHSVGRYRYAVYGVCDIYFIITTDKSNSELLAWETNSCARPNDYFIRSEFSGNGQFSNAPNGEIVISENFYTSLPAPENIGNKDDIILPGGPYYASMTIRNCKEGNGYDYSQQDESAARIAAHDGWEMGRLMISNCLQKTDDTYTVASNAAARISFALEQDPTALPKTDGVDLKEIEDDNYSGNVRDANGLNGKRIGQGAVYYMITYKDKTQGTGTYIDFFKNKANGTNIDICPESAFEVGKQTESVTIVLVYEVDTSGIKIFRWHEYTNWHLSATINFA
jgi:hypothetical protein